MVRVTRLWPFFSKPDTRENGSQIRALLKGNRRLGNFVISASPPDFTEFLHSTGPPLPDLRGLHSHMAKVECDETLICRYRDMPVKLTHLQLIYGVAGAREQFEELVVHLIRAEHPDVDRVRIVRGDGGIDAHGGSLASPNGIDVFQMKFFPDSIGDTQKNQIRESFKRICESKDFKTKSWTLCVPIDMSVDEKKWFEDWKDKQASTGIDIHPVWGAVKLEGLLYEDRNKHIRERFFKEEHLKQIREMYTTLERLARDFDERVPKPVPLVLRPHLVEVRPRRSYEYDADSIVSEVQLGFVVENVSSQSVANWTVQCEIAGLSQETLLTRQTFPKIGTGSSYIRLNSTILPTQSLTTEVIFGLRIRRSEALESQIRQLLECVTVTFHAISDNHISEKTTVALQEKIKWDQLLSGMRESLQKENIQVE